MEESSITQWLTVDWKIFEDLFYHGDRFTIYLALLLLAWVLYEWMPGKPSELPPGPRRVPIVGYLPFLGREPHKELDRLKKVYGNVFSLYLGRSYVVVLGDFEAVKEAFSKSTTLDRPKRLFDFIPDGAGFSSVNGEEWVEQRKFCVKSIRELGVGKDKWEETIQEEVEDFIKTVASHGGREFDISDLLTSSVSNNISYFVYGRRLAQDDPDRKTLDKSLEDVMFSFNQSSLGAFFPTIRDIQAALGVGTYGKLFDTLKRLNEFFRKEVEKIRESYKEGEVNNFTEDYLREMNKNKDKPDHYFNETNMYGNIQALFVGGSDTTRTSLYWLILAMAKFPDIQGRVQSEVDSVLGRSGTIRWSEKTKLPYTYATIMEGQRWITIAPINTARIATEDIRIKGYKIPKGTTILANNWGLHNDPKYWKNPEKFDPERFLDDGGEVILKPDSYNPFSYGKRSCPGENIAMMELLLYFTALMQNFTVSVPRGKELIMEGILGLTYQAVPQDLHFVPRGVAGTA